MKILKFTAPWCGPCKMMAPTIEAFKQENKDVEIIDIDVDVDEATTKKYKVMGVPTFIVVDEEGNKVASRSGFMTKEMFIGFVEEHK